MARPVVGISCCARHVGDETAQVVMHRYLEAVVRHADCAVVLVPARPDLVSPTELAERLDGLLLTGGPSNIEPERYGDSGPALQPLDRGRDEMSIGLIKATVALGRPVFGICRGFQELNVAFGGTLSPNLAAQGGLMPHHAPDGIAFDAMFDHAHDVALTKGGVLATAFGRDRLRVNSVHYQGIDRLGAGLKVEAVAPDGLIEAVSAEVNGAAVLGVQWHPEWQADQDAASAEFFRLFGRVLRGASLFSDRATII